MNLERFKDITTITQNLLIATAVVVGGAWTIFMFGVERPDKKAEREAFSQAVLNVEVKAEQIEMDDNGGLYIFAVAKLRNEGNRMAVLDLKDKPPFVISRLVFGTNVIADAKLAPAIEARNVTLTTDNALAPKSYDEYHVFVRLAEPGHYYVEFRAPLAKTEYENDPGIPKGATNWWGATRLEVKKRDTTPPPQ